MKLEASGMDDSHLFSLLLESDAQLGIEEKVEALSYKVQP